jgi:hypothetical protein
MKWTASITVQGSGTLVKNLGRFWPWSAKHVSGPMHRFQASHGHLTGLTVEHFLAITIPPN